VYHDNDSISFALLRFPNSSISFLPARQGEKASRRIKLSYLLYHSIQDNNLVDSASFVYKDTLAHAPAFFEKTLDLKAIAGSDYVLRIEVIDLATDKRYFLLKPFTKTVKASSNWFRLETERNGLLQGNYLSEDERLRLITSDTSIKTVTCKAFYEIFPAAIPPFVEKERQKFGYRNDSLFTLKLKAGTSDFIRLPHEGFYFFQADSNGKEGITFFRFYNGYPKIKTPQRMAESLRYITSSEEFNKLLSSAYPKETVDSFWVTTAGGPDRAVELIRSYYGRVEEANRFFVSFCEGWKTDRGIIYIMFGPPNVVYRSDQQELWTYGEANNYHSIQFLFQKVLNPFTENDYILQRQFNYKEIWYNAVQQWRR